MHKATYHENELLDMARATENRAVRLRKAIEHNRLVREQSRAGNAPEPSIQFGGNVRLTVGAPEPEPEPEPTPTEKPWVEVPCADGAWRYYRIVQFERTDDGRWRVHGDCISSWGTPWPNAWNTTAEVPFRIWEECQRKMVPCPEPPSIELTLNIGDRWRVFGVTELSISPDTGNTIIRCLGNRPQYAIRDAIEGTYYVTESPAAIRAACAEKGVPCPEEEKPKTVAVDTTPVVGEVAFTAVTELSVKMCPDGKPYLRIAGMADGTQREEWTRTPIADIRARAEAAGIKLPPVTVKCSGWTWTRISAVTVKARSNDTLDTTIVGVSDSGTGKEFPLSAAQTTPAQVCQLCELAGWPKPKVRMVCTYTDGAPCEVDPENISGVGVARHATTIETNAPLADGSCVHHVREPVAVVQRMIDACKEGE